MIRIVTIIGENIHMRGMVQSFNSVKAPVAKQ